MGAEPDQLGDPGRALLDDGPDDGLAAEPGPGLQGVPDMQLEAVLAARDRGDAPWAQLVFESARFFLVRMATRPALATFKA